MAPPAIRMHAMFDGHDPRWKKGRLLMKHLFDVRGRRMGFYEYTNCQNFIVDTMERSGWRTANLEDQHSFREMLKKSYVGTRRLGMNVPWRVLKNKYDWDQLLPVFEERNGKCYVAFVGPNDPPTDAVEFTQNVVEGFDSASNSRAVF